MNLSDAMRVPRREDLRARSGARVEARGTRFSYRVPRGVRAAIHLYDEEGHVVGRHELEESARAHDEWRETFVDGVTHGALYKLVVGERELPDPWARALPFGVSGPAMVWESRHAWRYGPVTRPIREQVIYAINVGAFTPEGTYAAAQRRLADLVQLGITTIALDGVAHYAPFAPYGTPDELRALIDHAHGLGLSVLLDVARNQLVVGSARYWVEEFRCDGLRLTSMDGASDRDMREVRDVVDEVRAVLPGVTFVAEGPTAPKLLDVGIDAAAAEDFPRQMRFALTQERPRDATCEPGVAGLAQMVQRGSVQQAEKHVFCVSRAFDEQLSRIVSLDAYCAASLLLMMLPMTPLLVMGQEWAASPSEKLRWDERTRPHHARVLSLYRTALAVRRFDPVLRRVTGKQLRAEAHGEVLVVRMESGEAARIVVANLGGRPVALESLDLPVESAVLMCSAARPVAPMSTTVFACSTRRAG